MKTLIKDAVIITMNRNRDVYWHGSILINGNSIEAVGPSADIDGFCTENCEVVEGSGFIVMPGLINTHFHLPQVLMRGVYDDVDSPMNKLKNYTWPIQGNYDESDALISTKLGVLEMLKSGTTTFLSTGLHSRYNIDTIVFSIIESGIRAGVSKYVMDLNDYALDKSAIHPGMWETGEDSKAQAIDLVEKWHGKGHGRVSAWISPRSVGSCSIDLFKWVARTARELKVGITAHWSEMQNNVDYSLEKFGKKPIFFAEDLGLLGSDVVLAHGIYVDDNEIKLLAETGTNIAHCPRCNSKLAMGYAPVPKYLEAGLNVSLANDGLGVNNTADIFREMRSMLFMHRNYYKRSDYPRTIDALEMATINGAKSMSLSDKIGSLEKGKLADLIMIDYQKSHIVPLHDPVSAVVWAVSGQDVHSVMIDGNFVMKDRQVITMDEKDILKDVEKIKNKILEQANISIKRDWNLY